jgi:hypothetical protein
MIEDYHFGLIKIDGQEFEKDVFIDLDEKVSPWWREESHLFQKKDVESFLDKKPEVVIFGTGKQGIAKSSKELEDFLEGLGIEMIIEPTDQAVENYNQAKKQGKKVVAFLHLTC